MTKTIALMTLVFSFAFVAFVGTASAQTNVDAAKRTEKFRQKVKSVGTGADVKVTVYLFGDKTVKGFVDDSNDKDFTVIQKDGSKAVIQYGDVKEFVRKSKVGAVTTGIAIGIVAGVATFATIFWLALMRN